MTPSGFGLQLGLSTLDSFTEDLPPAFSRSISWRSATEPLGKPIDPQAVFEMLVSGRPDPLAPKTPDPAADARRATRKSVLDFVLGDATAIQPRLSGSDRRRLDQFMTSVRDLEQRVTTLPAVPPPGCMPVDDVVILTKVPQGLLRVSWLKGTSERPPIASLEPTVPSG